MRKRPLVAAAIAVASVAVTLGAPTVAQANTSKEVKVCWTSPTGSNYPIKVVLDGPTSRSKMLASGECKAWSVKPGEYKVVWTEVDDYYRAIYNSNYDTYDDYKTAVAAICGTLPAAFDGVRNVDATAAVKRFKNAYVTSEVGNDGTIRTTVQNNRQTKINFRMHCDYYLD
jgi:hypothetical protein